MDNLVADLRRELHSDSEGVRRALAVATHRAGTSPWPLSWFWRRRLERLERDRISIANALELKDLYPAAPDASRKLFLFTLGRAAGLKVNGLADQPVEVVSKRMKETLGRPRWQWKYEFRFRRLVLLTLAGVGLLTASFLLSSPFADAAVLLRLVGGGATLAGGGFLTLLLLDRGLR